MPAGGDADKRSRRNPLGFNDLGELDIRAA